MKSRADINVGLGVLIWAAFLAHSSSDWTGGQQIDALILFGVAGITPLSTQIVFQVRRDGKLPWLERISIIFQPICVVMVSLALILPVGVSGGILSLGWLLQTSLLSMIGLKYWLSAPTFLMEEFCINIGYVYVAISGIWFVVYRASGEFMGFSGPLVPLTVVHFTYISLAGLVMIGLAGRQLRAAHGPHDWWYRLTAICAVLSPPLVAIGITVTNSTGAISLIEVIAVVMLALSYLSLAGLVLFKIQPAIKSRYARLALSLSAMTLFLTMALAAGYSFGRISGWWQLTIPNMVRWHGWFNGLGFAGMGLLGWRLAVPLPRGNPPGIPFSRLPWRWHIGPEFFTRIGALDEAKPRPQGIVDKFSVYEADGCEIGQLDPAIGHFYEQTARHQLLVTPLWNRRFLGPARIYKRWSRRVGQMNLPLLPEADEGLIHSTILPLSDALDGREDVRAWIRTYKETGEAVYVAAYSSHCFGGICYMNIAFPLPGGNLTSVLHLKTRREGSTTSLSLSSLSSASEPGDQGVYFSSRFFTIRLPFNEIIEVSSGPPDDFPTAATYPEASTVFARHRMWLFGKHFLTLFYAIWPLEQA